MKHFNEKGVKLKGVSPETKKRVEEWKKWAETEEGKLRLEKGSLKRQKISIQMFENEMHNEMESRKDIPFCMQPRDASYWMNRRPIGNIEEIDKRIAEIDAILGEEQNKNC